MAQLARYEQIEILGRGACGEVILAKDGLRDGELVALKRIRTSMDAAVQAALQREFATLAALALPGVAPVLDLGTLEPEGEDPGGAFLTRRYVAGQPLDAAASEVDLSTRLRWMARACEVAALLHRAGVVHADLKPGNIIVDAQGQVHVIDFGLARLRREPRERASRVSGTPAFMAPELLRGEAPSVAADVYALGVTLWLLVSERLPREGEAHSERFAAQAESSTLQARALHVAAHAMNRDAWERYASVDEMRAALQRLLDEPDPAVPVPFVAPRPRGREEVLETLQADLDAAWQPGARERGILLCAAEGGGKSTVLRELKWRLQLRGVQVLELGARAGRPLGALVDILRYATLLRRRNVGLAQRATRVLERFEEGGSLPLGELQDIAGELVLALRGGGRVVVLADDVDRVERAFGDALRAMLYGEGCEHVAVVATATDPDAPGVQVSALRRRHELRPLSVEQTAALAQDVLGSIDESIVHALQERSGGIPGALVGTLASLPRDRLPSTAEIAELPMGAAACSAAERRYETLPSAARELLGMLVAAGGAAPVALLERVCDAGFAGAGSLQDAIAACRRSGVSVDEGGMLVVADRAMQQVVEEAYGGEALAALAVRLLALADGTVPMAVRARLALQARDEAQASRYVPAAAEPWVAAGAYAAAADLYRRWLSLARGASAQEARGALASVRYAQGEYADAAELGEAAAADTASDGASRLEGALVAARAWSALGSFERATSLLTDSSLLEDASRSARALRELARIQLRRGDYDAAFETAANGLQRAPSGDLACVELLTTLGMVHSYRGENDEAHARYEEALAIAREAESLRDEANVLMYLAIGHQRAGELERARGLSEHSLEIAQRLGDVGSMASFSLNLGAQLFLLGDPAEAARRYEAAVKLARRAGRASTELTARNNLVNLHVYLGMFERARVEVEQALRDAEALGMKVAAAQALGYQGDLAARTGDVERALACYDAAIARYRTLKQHREIAEASLDAAEALLHRAGAADASAAARRLATARQLIDAHALDEFHPRLTLLLGTARLANGDFEGALPMIEQARDQAVTRHDNEVEWQAWSAAGTAQRALGADALADAADRRAMELLERIALRIPRERRESFWHDPRRLSVRRRVEATSSRERTADADSSDGLRLDARVGRLLELIKRLAREHELDRLLERVTESAVDLSGAERGIVLLVDEGGALEPRTVRSVATLPDAHREFSRSIAEAVLIDGDPIVTTDATRDARLSEYASVHSLALRSVACLPIRGRDGVLGVLYLEHRRRTGRFRDQDLDLLRAFADQAAIALENARLIQENVRRQNELEHLNEQLAAAKRDMEELLVARTDELDEARRELERARERSGKRATRFGMVGASEPMRRFFATLERVRATHVPVVIEGESGTGKELAARALHYEGPRATGPFVVLNCAAVPESLLESELFGHVRGAFSGADRDRAGVIARASGGTLLLDEVGDMPLRMQVDLLRVLQEGVVRPVGSDREQPVDVRFVAASNRPLAQLVEEGRFREDLFYRLDVVRLQLPPLRDRPDDIPLLCDHFLQAIARKEEGGPKRLTPAALERLKAHAWPGNVRQLEHVLLNAWVLVEGAVISAESLSLPESRSERASVPPQVSRAEPQAAEGAMSASQRREEERSRILEALHVHDWNRARAARALGMPRRTFYRRLRDYEILT